MRSYPPDRADIQKNGVHSGIKSNKLQKYEKCYKLIVVFKP